MLWGGSKDGSFTVMSAYAFLTRDAELRPNMEEFYNRGWRVIAPERVRVFLWLVAHQAIMTNMERKRRHISENSVCPLCKGGEETIFHVLRDCPAASGLWARTVPLSKQPRFFNQTLMEFLFENLGRKKSEQRDLWPTFFALTVWWCWKWRCGYVFGEKGKCRYRVQFLKDKAQEVISANVKLRMHLVVRERVEKQISRLRPVNGWFIVN